MWEGFRTARHCLSRQGGARAGGAGRAGSHKGLRPPSRARACDHLRVRARARAHADGFQRRVFLVWATRMACFRATDRSRRLTPCVRVHRDGFKRLTWTAQREKAKKKARARPRRRGSRGGGGRGARRTRGGCRLGGVCAECVDDKSRLVFLRPYGVHWPRAAGWSNSGQILVDHSGGTR